MLAKHGKKIIGWDEILEGGLSPEATVMSWRGEAGGIASALQDHDAIMTPGGNGMYLDTFQGDSKIEPVSIGGYTLLEKVYSYNPVSSAIHWSLWVKINILKVYRLIIGRNICTIPTLWNIVCIRVCWLFLKLHGLRWIKRITKTLNAVSTMLMCV